MVYMEEDKVDGHTFIQETAGFFLCVKPKVNDELF